jgi:hypothetical protein
VAIQVGETSQPIGPTSPPASARTRLRDSPESLDTAGLLRVTQAGVVFSHPLVRSAALAGSDVAERMAGHQALADVLDGDRRAWHLAALATGPDEEVAAALDAAAQRAAHRGSSAAVSAAYERAATGQGTGPAPASQITRLTWPRCQRFHRLDTPACPGGGPSRAHVVSPPRRDPGGALLML